MKHFLIFFIALGLLLSCNTARVEENNAADEFTLEEIGRVYLSLEELKHPSVGQDDRYVLLMNNTKETFAELNSSNGTVKTPIQELLNQFKTERINISSIEELLALKDDLNLRKLAHSIELALLNRLYESWSQEFLISKQYKYRAIEVEKDKFLFCYLPCLDSTNSRIYFRAYDTIANKMISLDTSNISVANNYGLYYITDKNKNTKTGIVQINLRNGNFIHCNFETK